MSAKMKESISDSELQRDVLDELRWDPGVNAAHIGVSAKNGVSPSVAMCRRTGRSTRPGVMAVANELEVKPPGSSQSSQRTDGLSPRPA